MTSTNATENQNPRLELVEFDLPKFSESLKETLGLHDSIRRHLYPTELVCALLSHCGDKTLGIKNDFVKLNGPDISLRFKITEENMAVFLKTGNNEYVVLERFSGKKIEIGVVYRNTGVGADESRVKSLVLFGENFVYTLVSEGRDTPIETLRFKGAGDVAQHRFFEFGLAATAIDLMNYQAFMTGPEKLRQVNDWFAKALTDNYSLIATRYADEELVVRMSASVIAVVTWCAMDDQYRPRDGVEVMLMKLDRHDNVTGYVNLSPRRARTLAMDYELKRGDRRIGFELTALREAPVDDPEWLYVL